MSSRTGHVCSRKVTHLHSLLLVLEQLLRVSLGRSMEKEAWRSSGKQWTPLDLTQR